MQRSWQEVKAELEQETGLISLEPPVEVVRIFRDQVLESGAGTHAQCITAWVFIAGDTRYLAYYGVTNVIALADESEISLSALRIIARQMMMLSAEFLGYCGLKKLYFLFRQVDSVLDQVQSREEFVELMSALANYAATFSIWVQHYFPWQIGDQFPHRKPA